MRISVIIPVFNLENYIIRNLESMIKQVGEEIEFIYINDGSTDDSLQILQKYQKKDARIKIISQENKGQSAARNRGLQEARGEVIIFVDGDDYIVDGSLILLESIVLSNNLEIVLADQKIVDETNNKNDARQEKIQCENVMTGIELMKEKAVFTNCLYIYRRSFLEKYHMRFLEGIIHEDLDFVPRALFYAQRALKVNYAFYFHVMRKESTTHMQSIKRSKNMFQIANVLSDFIVDNHMNQNVKAYFEQYRISLYLQGIHVAFVGGFKISDLICCQLERRYLIEQLNMGSKKCKLVAYVLCFHLDELYRKMYLIYRKRKNRSLKKKVTEVL